VTLPPGTRFATFVDGVPLTASLEDLRAAAGIQDLEKAIDDATAEARDRVNAVAGATGAAAEDLRAQAVRARESIDTVVADVGAVVNDAVPRIDRALTDAGQRITDARDEIDAERRRAVGAEERLDERITNVAADAGYDDTAVRAEVSRVDRARADGDRALGEQIDAVQSSYRRVVSSDLPVNMIDPQRWTSDENSDTPAPMAATDPRFTANGEGVAIFLTGAGESAVIATMASFKPTPGHTYRATWKVRRWYSGSPEARLGAGFVVRGVDGSRSYPSSDYGSSQVRDAPDHYSELVAEWTAGDGHSWARPRIHINRTSVAGARFMVAGAILEDLSDLRAVDARVTREAATLARADKAIADRQDIVEAQLSGTSDSGLRQQVNAQIEDRATTIADAKAGAVAERVGRLETRVDGVPAAINARAEQAERTAATATQGVAGRTSVLEVTAASGKGAENANPDFSAWPDGQALPTGWAPWGASGPCTRAVASLGGGGWAADRIPSDIDAGMANSAGVYLTGGWYIFRAKVWKLRASWNGAGVTWGGLYNIDFMSDPDLAGKVGDTDTGGVREWAKPVYIEPAHGGEYRGWHAMDNWSAFGRGFSDKTLRWFMCRVDRASQAEIDGFKAGQALNGPGGALARLTSSEATLADLPNRYAAASRAAALEAQVNGEAGSRLLARADERATAVADQKAGAVVGTVNQLRAEYNGTVGEVNRQGGVIVDLSGRTRSYLGVSVVAGQSIAEATIYADGAAGSLMRLRADNIIMDANVLVLGSLTTDRVAQNAITGTTVGSGFSADVYAGGAVDVSPGVTIVSSGGLLKVDVMSDGLRTGGTGRMSVQLFADISGQGRVYLSRNVYFSPLTTAAPVSFYHVLNVPAGTTVTFYLGHAVDGRDSSWRYSSAAIAVTEFKR